MTTQFDLEQAIMSCWNITTDLHTLLEEIIEGDLTNDQISNVILGLETLYEIKFNKAFRIFEEYIKESKNTEEELEFVEDENGYFRFRQRPTQTFILSLEDEDESI